MIYSTCLVKYLYLIDMKFEIFLHSFFFYENEVDENIEAENGKTLKIYQEYSPSGYLDEKNE